jgi:hypothetical protein
MRQFAYEVEDAAVPAGRFRCQVHLSRCSPSPEIVRHITLPAVKDHKMRGRQIRAKLDALFDEFPNAYSVEVDKEDA